MTFKGKILRKIYNSEEGYDLYASQYEKTHEYLDTFEHNEIFRMCGNIEGKNVLDAGCGTGRLIKRLKDLKGNIYGCDISEKMLGIARKKNSGVEFLKADLENMPYEDAFFDVVIAGFVIVHFKYMDKLFEEIYRVLKPGGIIIISNVNQRKPPKVKSEQGETIIINSFYHRPEDVLNELKNTFFEIMEEKFIYENRTWINQIVKAVK